MRLASAMFVIFVSSCALTTPTEKSPGVASHAAMNGASLRVFSWNAAGDSLLKHPATFRALVRMSQANILLLDEVSPATSEARIRDALPAASADGKARWHIDIGASGGRQRDVIISRMPLEHLPEFAGVVPYPPRERRRLHERMVAANENSPDFSMAGGIPMNGAVVLTGKRRLLVVSLDLQCCGNDPQSWQEARRRLEVREIHRHVARVLRRTHVDAVIIAGDFNLVSTPLPLVIASGPYSMPNAGLIVAQLHHRKTRQTWTWDGRGTRWPSSPLDFSLYTPQTLRLAGGYILDTEDISNDRLEKFGLHRDSMKPLSRHRPLVVRFQWR